MLTLIVIAALLCALVAPTVGLLHWIWPSVGAHRVARARRRAERRLARWARRT
jgi:multisubunit Na+/H+ antiporter MnhG subunit